MFLSFSKEEKIWFITKGNDEIIPVKFILNANSNEELISINLDIENISQIPTEKEVLILPLSCFEIENIKETIDNNIKIKEIHLNYLSYYKIQTD